MIWLLMLFQNAISTIFGRFERLSGFITLLYLGYLSGTADIRHNADYQLYMNSYNLNWDNFESGYTALAQFAQAVGLTYVDFRLWSMIITYLLFFIALSLLTKRVAGVTFFYSIASFSLDAIQVRHLMATVFILFAIAVLLRMSNVLGIIFSVGILIVGSKFHSISLFFLIVPVFMLFKLKLQNQVLKFAVLAYVFGLLMYTPIRDLLITFLSKAVNLISNRSNLSENLISVYSNAPSIGFWTISVGVIIMLFLGYYWLFTTMKQIKSGFVESITMQVYAILFIIGAIGITLMAISIDYVRIIRIINIFLFILAFLVTDILFKQGRWQSAWAIYLFILVYSVLFLLVQLRIIYVIPQDFEYIVGLLNPNVMR